MPQVGSAESRLIVIRGNSGSGKSTLARVLMRLVPADGGTIRFDGEDWLALSGGPLRRRRAKMQMVFQDVLGAFNPRATVASVIEDPLRIHGTFPKAGREREVAALLDRVGLPASYAARSIRDVSGGQRQRIAIARAIAARPAMIVLDEAVSALDVSLREKVLELLVALQAERGIAYLFISHDLSVVRHIAHDVMVMYLGNAIEHGPKERIYARPLHPYTQALLASTPRVDAGKRERIILRGELPSPLKPPKGCVFSTRCPHVTDRCRAERPEKREIDGRKVACHYAEDFLAKAA